MLGTVQAYTVFVHPQDPETVFAGTNDGVWRSTDRGATFRRTNFPDAKKQVWCFMVDSRDPKRIFAGASPIDVYRSDDGGDELAQAGDARHRQPLQGSVRVPRDALCPAPEEAGRDLRRARDQRRDAQHRRRRDLDRIAAKGLIKLAELPHLKSKIVSDTTAEGMLDGHAVTINPADPDAAIVALRMGLFRTADQRQDLAGHGDPPLLADHLWPRRQGLADRTQHPLCRALGRRRQP